MNMSNVIWADMEAYNGRGWKDPDAPKVEPEQYGCASKRECPCDTCPMNQQCLENATECSAMRNWCSYGDFKDKDLQRLVRGVA
jgi:hypothetical protein